MNGIPEFQGLRRAMAAADQAEGAAPSLGAVRQVLESERARIFTAIGVSMRRCADLEERLKAIIRDLEAERAQLADLQRAERAINAAIRAANAGMREGGGA